MGEFSIDFKETVEAQAANTERANIVNSRSSDFIKLYIGGEIDFDTMASNLSDIAKSKEELFLLGMLVEKARNEKAGRDIMNSIFKPKKDE